MTPVTVWEWVVIVGVLWCVVWALAQPGQRRRRARVAQRAMCAADAQTDPADREQWAAEFRAQYRAMSRGRPVTPRQRQISATHDNPI